MTNSLDANRSDILAGMAAMSAYQLAGTADCGTPDSPDSAGAQLLTSVRDGVVELLASLDHDALLEIAESPHDLDVNDDGELDRIADGAADYRTATRWSEFVDLAGYSEDISDYGQPSADDLTDSVAGVALYMIAQRLTWALAASFAESLAESVDDD